MKSVALINTLSEEDLPDILIMADKLIGKGYISKAELQKYIDDSNKTALVARKNDVITGFQLMLTCGMNELLTQVLCEPNWFKEQFSGSFPIGILKTVAVRDEFINQGIGTDLTKRAIKMLERASNCIISICWDQGDHTPILAILEKCGMKLTHRIKEYWREDSLKKSYQCKICGSPPCRCNGLIYQYCGDLNSNQIKQELALYNNS